MNDVLASSKPRLVWIDWMKTLAMYFIIAGHCNVPGNKYIYVFSVPCFFVLSGFLTKKESDNKLFWKKIRWNLVVPMILLLLIHMAYVSALKLLGGKFEINYIWHRLLNSAIGNQGQDCGGGLGVLWFVYTLVLCKIIIQFIPASIEKIVLCLLSVLMLIGCIVLNNKGIVVYNSIVDVLLAMPFITIGYLARPLKEKITLLKKERMPILLIFGGLGVWLCGTYNDIVYLYCCSYGSSILLCLIGSICGTVLIYAFSRLFEMYLVDFVNIVGGGTLIILGLHGIVMSIISKIVYIPGTLLYGKALLILLLLVPVILFIKKHLSLLYGKQRN